VSEGERIVLVLNAFKRNLMHALEATAKALPRLDEEDRLVPILTSLAKQHSTTDYVSNTTANITAAQVPQLHAHFPPCMQQLHNALLRDAHLKHTSRLYLGLFLKGIGLSLDEALVFWRSSFSRMSDDEYAKKGYPYGIRYNYGMEGKRTNYTPYSYTPHSHMFFYDK
jgi:DNA primase large subunit